MLCADDLLGASPILVQGPGARLLGDTRARAEAKVKGSRNVEKVGVVFIVLTTACNLTTARAYGHALQSLTKKRGAGLTPCLAGGPAWCSDELSEGAQDTQPMSLPLRDSMPGLKLGRGPTRA